VLVCVLNSVLYPDADHGITTYFFCLDSYLIQCLQAVSPLQAFVSHLGAVDSCCQGSEQELPVFVTNDAGTVSHFPPRRILQL
jgi:hypothetical protein